MACLSRRPRISVRIVFIGFSKIGELSWCIDAILMHCNHSRYRFGIGKELSIGLHSLCRRDRAFSRMTHSIYLVNIIVIYIRSVRHQSPERREKKYKSWSWPGTVQYLMESDSLFNTENWIEGRNYFFKILISTDVNIVDFMCDAPTTELCIPCGWCIVYDISTIFTLTKHY